MLTQDVFTEHKREYTIYRKKTTLDHYRNEQNTFEAGGTITAMFTPVSDVATIQAYGEKISTMKQGIVYDETEFEEHDQVEIDGDMYEIVTIQVYPSYRLVQVRRI